MKFQPKSEKELAEANLIPAKTICDFEVIEAKDTVSKTSNAEMIAIKLKVFYNDGFKLVNDYLLEAMASKLRHFCEASGLMKEYADGSLRAEHCLGACGKLKVAIEDKNDGYQPKNKVGDYVVPAGKKVLVSSQVVAPANADPSDNGWDSDVPF